MTALEHGQNLEAHGRFADAIAAYDQAIATSRTDARLHGLAWMNRGHALLVADQPASAADSFRQAVVHFEKLPLEASPYFRLNLAGARTNLAHTLLATEPDASRPIAQSALDVLAGVDRSHPVFAEMSLRARRAFVMSLDARAERTLISAATDAIDDGLALARHWEEQGVDGLRPLAIRLFRLGAQLYRMHQPHFLGEFILEALACDAFAADGEFRAAATEAVDLALAELQRPQILTVDDAGTARLVETAATLRAARQRLASLDTQLPPAAT